MTEVLETSLVVALQRKRYLCEGDFRCYAYALQSWCDCDEFLAADDLVPRDTMIERFKRVLADRSKVSASFSQTISITEAIDLVRSL